MKIESGYFARLALVSSLLLASFAGVAGALESRGVPLPSLYSTSEPQNKSTHLRSVSSRSPKADARSKSPAPTISQRGGHPDSNRSEAEVFQDSRAPPDSGNVGSYSRGRVAPGDRMDPRDHSAPRRCHDREGASPSHRRARPRDAVERRYP